MPYENASFDAVMVNYDILRAARPERIATESTLQDLLAPVDDELLEVCLIWQGVKKSQNQGPELIEPVART